MVTTHSSGFQTIPMDTVQALYDRHVGGHWFDRSTMTFFGTKLPGYAYVADDGHYFITSERNPSGKTAFTIRHQNKVDFKIKTVGDFHAYETAAQALGALVELLKEKSCVSG